MSRKLTATEKKQLKKLLELPDELLWQELCIAWDLENFFGDKKKLNAYKLKYKKEIQGMDKRIDIKKIRARANQLTAKQKSK